MPGPRGVADDLKKLPGVSPAIEKQLNDLGIFHYTQIAELSAELDVLKGERAAWERRIVLLKPESIDPDMLDERARILLNYADPRELTLRLKQP